MDKEKKQNKFLNKYLKWFILVLSIFIAIIIKYKNSYTALTLIPSIILAFLQSNIKQEELAEMQIDEMKKQQKEKEEQEKIEKMLKFFYTSCKNRDEKSIKIFRKKLPDFQAIGTLCIRQTSFEKFCETLDTTMRYSESLRNILKIELLKIFNDNTFDFDKETWKSDFIEKA